MENLSPIQLLILIMAGAALLVITSVLSYQLGKSEGYLLHMEDIQEEDREDQY